MRDGYYTVHGQRVSHKMQFCEGDVLPIDVTVPTGVDVDAPPVGAPAALPKVLPEQLVGRRFCEETFDGPVVAEIALSNDTELPLMLVYAHDDLLPTLLVSVEEALRNLIGEAPVVEVELQDAPTAAEVVAAQASQAAAPAEVEAEAATKEPEEQAAAAKEAPPIPSKPPPMLK